MKRYRIEMGCYSLHIECDADADFDGRFKAKCLDTGDMLWINGWLIESMDEEA